MKSNSFFQTMEFHINGEVREKCNLNASLFSSCGNMILADIQAVHNFVFNFNMLVTDGAFGKKQAYLKASELNAMGLLDEIFHYMLRLYRTDTEKDFFKNGYEFINTELKKRKLNELDILLEQFCQEFPPKAVYTKETSIKKWLLDFDKTSSVPNKFLALEEFMLLQLAVKNPANSQFAVLFNDVNLKKDASYNAFWEIAKLWSKKNTPFMNSGIDILSMLEEPIKYSPYSLKGQLEFIKKNWAKFIKNILLKILHAEDFISEEEKTGWSPPANGNTGGCSIPAYSFENLLNEYEHFSPDKNWMPNVVLIAKSILVWLDQLSKKYSADIKRLDQIPDKELQFLAERGINGLWLIGIWQRSEASKRIKQIYGNAEAAASAYSLYDYDIAEELGGWQALENLRARAWHYGLRLAADMVPNHTGIDSKWVMEQPNFFLQCSEKPFPAYNFSGENLSQDGRTSIFLENGYYAKTDCAVVFKRQDNSTGDVRYIYHGNDGTGLPWNDTAQIDFLNAEAREAVIQKILHVAKNFPIIRFDAAMVLTKKHIRRLWYPEPGHGGDIASRSSYAMNREEFERKIPEEFWREVVDRCAAEVPDTLLLAEAFWMMEGYFVRTLGMHRVYNSAFMNMLKREENAKYRETIKNTLEFDPEILKRYVNFMNNPDEETAIVQFGDGDKYFGVCTMMSTMPGLPMFGHGQLEGFEEKYGMEFRKAYKNEELNSWLLDRHEKEIFPLLRKRYIFSGVENFRLFDFWNNGAVNENVFAWTNVFFNEKSLIFYNNAYQSTAGYIKTSAAFAVKKTTGEKFLQQTELLEALQLTNSETYFTVFWEAHSNLFFIKKNSELVEKGFFAMLAGYQTQVFLNIYETEDTDGSYFELYKTLNGSGVQNLERKLKKIKLKELYSALGNLTKEIYLKEFFLLHSRFTQLKAKKEKEDLINTFLENFKNDCSNFFKNAAALKKCTEGTKRKKTPDAAMSKKLYLIFKKFAKYFLNLTASNYDKTFFQTETEAKCFTECEISILYFYSLIILPLLKIFTIHEITELQIAEELSEIFLTMGLNKGANILDDIKACISALTSNRSINELFCNNAKNKTKIQNNTQIPQILKRWFSDSAMRTYLCVNEWNGISWFNKERAEFAAFIETVFISKNYEKTYSELCMLFKKSEYKTEKLLENI